MVNAHPQWSTTFGLSGKISQMEDTLMITPREPRA